MKEDIYPPSFTQKIKTAFRGFLLLLGFSLAVFAAHAQTGEALRFDGTNDQVQLPLSFSGNYTKEVWINTTVMTGFPNILSGTGTALFLNAGKLAAGHAPDFDQVVDPVAVPSGTWVHIAVTFNAGTQTMKIYKNAVLVGTATGVPAYTETTQSIGVYAGGNFFSGRIDEVRFWKAERTQAEIASDMSCELTGDEPNLLAYYNFNQGEAGSANPGVNTLYDLQDKCIPANGTLQNFALAGATSNWVQPGPVLSGACANSFSNISVSGNSVCISSGDVTPSAADHTSFGNGSGSPVVRTFTITNTGTAVLNITNVQLTGTNASDFSVSAAPPATLAAGASATFDISFDPAGAAGTKTATVAILNDDADESSFAFAINGLFGTAGQALALDGVNDRVDLPFTFSGNYTKEIWVKTNVLTGFPNILSGTGTALFLNAGRPAAGHAPAFNQVLDPAPLAANTWYHLAVTYNATTQIMRLYKNGVQVASATGVPAYTETTQQVGTFDDANFFGGSVDEIRFWNTERSAGEIAGSYSCSLGGGEPGLIAYYNCNQGVGGANNAGNNVLRSNMDRCAAANGTMVNFALTGTVSNWVAPGATLTGSCTPGFANIAISGNGNCINLGDMTPSINDNTDFGNYYTPGIDKVFTITNSGNDVLNIGTIVFTGTNSSSFTVLTAPAASVPAGGSTSFTIRFSPVGGPGVKNATATINSDDIDEPAYSFAVKGLGEGALPVDLVSFTGIPSGHTALLHWVTAMELNNRGFDILRSPDGTNGWETIGFVPAGPSASGNTYGFTDTYPLAGLNAYQLRQVDIDGHTKLSNIVALHFNDGTAVSVSVFPNPVAGRITLRLTNRSLINTTVAITNASGTIVLRARISSSRQEIDLSGLSAGVYFIAFSNGEVKRVVKQ